MSDPQHPQGDPPTPAEPPRRKRVVAREIDPAEADDRQDPGPPADAAIVPAPVRPPSFESDTVLVIPSAPDSSPQDHRTAGPDPLPVVDPTLLGQRHRRTRHHRVYRWTQMLTALCGLAAGVSIFCTMLGESLVGRILAGIATGFGMIAVLLSTRTSLSMRWRGWAVAATVFALVALAITWIHDAFTDHEDDGAPPPPIKSKG
jgi:hypothetical protein